MLQRSFTWTFFLVLLLLAGLLLLDWQDTLVNRIALIEVDNQSGRPLTAIEARWAGSEQHWPGVATGESALASVVVEKPGRITLTLQPGDAQASSEVAAGQRFYVRLTPKGIDMNVSDDPSLSR